MKKVLIAVLLLSLWSCNQGSKSADESSHSWLINKIKINQGEYKNNLIYMQIPMDNDTLTFFTDTGGGRFVYPEIASEGFKIDSLHDDEGILETIDLEWFFSERNIPSPPSALPVYRGDRFRSDFNAGLLGSFWFGNRKWEFDYENKDLYSLDSVIWSKVEKRNISPLGFQKDSLGTYTTHFPSIEIIVEQDTIPMLFDTGATISMSSDSLNNESNVDVAGSFIIASIFEKWRTDNPNWKVIEDGDASIGADIIEVPEVTIANQNVGPVWFAKRADRNFVNWMSQWMDIPIEGAIGGSCFKYFDSVIIDYPNQKAIFLR